MVVYFLWLSKLLKLIHQIYFERITLNYFPWKQGTRLPHGWSGLDSQPAHQVGDHISSKAWFIFGWQPKTTRSFPVETEKVLIFSDILITMYKYKKFTILWIKYFILGIYQSRVRNSFYFIENYQNFVVIIFCSW